MMDNIKNNVAYALGRRETANEIVGIMLNKVTELTFIYEDTSEHRDIRELRRQEAYALVRSANDLISKYLSGEKMIYLKEEK